MIVLSSERVSGTSVAKTDYEERYLRAGLYEVIECRNYRLTKSQSGKATERCLGKRIIRQKCVYVHILGP